MRKLAQVIFFSGFLLMLAAAFMAFEKHMTDDRRTASRNSINAWLDKNSEQYEQNRKDGCRRRCGGFGSLSHAIVNLRDGIFLSLPFSPRDVLPDAPTGWVKSEYSLERLQEHLGNEFRKPKFIYVTTEDKIARSLERIHDNPKTGAIAIYSKDDNVIVVAIKVSRKGIRAAMEGKNHRYETGLNRYASLDGVKLRQYSQYSYNSDTNKYRPVLYRRFLMELHGQVEMTVLAKASDAEIQTMLSHLDMATIVKDLPIIPKGYAPGTGVTLATPVVSALE